MADGDAIRDTSETITELLRAGIPSWVLPSDQIVLANYVQLAHLPALDHATITVFLHQVEVRYELRDRSQSRGLPLRLSYVITPWAMDVEAEHRLLGRIAQVIDAGPSVPPALFRGDGWDERDILQLAIEQPERADRSQLWDSMKLPFRPSIYCQANLFELAGIPLPDPA